MFFYLKNPFFRSTKLQLDYVKGTTTTTLLLSSGDTPSPPPPLGLGPGRHEVERGRLEP
jgi:hypothetical protein